MFKKKYLTQEEMENLFYEMNRIRSALKVILDDFSYGIFIDDNLDHNQKVMRNSSHSWCKKKLEENIQKLDQMMDITR